MEDARIGENLKNILDFVGAFIVISFEVVMLGNQKGKFLFDM